MTNADLDVFVERWDLSHPVEMDDLAKIKAQLDQLVHAGAGVELVLRGNRVELLVGVFGPFPAQRWLEVRGTPPAAQGVAALVNARA